MKTMILLAMHGIPPSDFPRAELMEYMSLHAGHEAGELDPASHGHYEALEVKMRTWPRTPQNDPFFTASNDLAARLKETSGLDVLVGFNEFCAPDILQAVGQAASLGAEKVIVTTPMLTRGGEHAEKDIPEELDKARLIYPQLSITYAWPCDSHAVAEFLHQQVLPYI
jgi:sirohydrochlorin cobaltochelatase